MTSVNSDSFSQTKHAVHLVLHIARPVVGMTFVLKSQLPAMSMPHLVNAT